VPFAAGGVADITARVLSQKMSEAMGQQVLVENRPSAGGIIASEAVAKANQTATPLLFITNGNAVSASLFKSLPYDTLNDFAPISTVGFFDLVMVVNSDSKIGSVGELIASARANPNKLNIARSTSAARRTSLRNFSSRCLESKRRLFRQGNARVILALKGNDVQWPLKSWHGDGADQGRCPQAARSNSPTSATGACRMFRPLRRAACAATRRLRGTASPRRQKRPRS